MLMELEAILGYTFCDISLLENALSHSSYANERYHNSLRSNERLEFLGDAVLGVTVAEYLYKNFPDRPEGELTRMRADMVCETTLAGIAQSWNLGQHLLLGKGEDALGGRERASILADAVESIIAAAYLDGGSQAATAIIERFVLSQVPVSKMHNVDYKTALQERIQQKRNQVLSYRPLGERGPDHCKEFLVEVLLNNEVVGTGIGSSKKRAEQDAAKAAMQALFSE